MLNTSIGIGIRSGGISNSRGWITQLVNRYDTAPSSDLRAIIQHGGELLKNAGLIDALDFFYCLKLHTKQACQQNWIQDRFNLLEVGGVVTFAQYTGCGAPSVSVCFNSGLNPMTSSDLKMSLNDVCIGGRNIGTGANQWLMGSYDGSNTLGIGMTSGFYGNNGTILSRNANYPALVVGQRDGAASVKYYEEGVVTTSSDSNDSVALPNKDLYIIGHNNNGSVFRPMESPRYGSWLFGGKSLTPAKHQALHNIITELDLLINSL